MKSIASLLIALLTTAAGASVGLPAFAEPIIDYVPVGASLVSELADDVSGTRQWVLKVSLKHQGNVVGRPRTMKIRVNTSTFNSTVYGGAASNFAAGGAIRPGETGIARIVLPSGNYDFVRGLDRCEVNAKIHIDTDRSKQAHYLDFIWANDVKILALKDALWVRRCLIRQPLIGPVFP